MQSVLTIGADNQEASVTAFEEYMDKAFPTVKNRKKKKHDQMMDVLKHWVGQGPIKVTPMGGAEKVRSKMVHRMSSIEEGPIAKATAKIGGIRTK